MEDAASQVKPVQAEKPGAENPHVQAVAQGHGDCRGNLLLLSLRLGLRHGRQEKHRHGVGDGGREHDKGQMQ